MWFAAFIASLTFLAHRCFASTNLLQKKKIQVGWEQLDKKTALVPGIPELGMGIPTNKAAFQAGLSPHPIDRYHSGNPERDTCQPWENCSNFNARNLTEVTTTPFPTMNISKDGNATFFNASNATDKGNAKNPLASNRACDHEWDLTKQGCQCYDSCECNRPTRTGERICQTIQIRTVSYTNVTEFYDCGDYDGATQKFTDTCRLMIAPTPEPEIYIAPSKKKQSKGKGKEKSLYRDFGAKNNKRFLPKKSCFSKAFYCSSFPMFEGCVPGVTYEYSEEMMREVEECKAIEGQKDCEGKESCGKGKHKTCHHQCVWSEDAPGWFRKLRGEQTMWLKKYQRDPAQIGKGNKLPILQPAWDGSPQQDEDEETIVAGSKKKAAKAAEKTTPPPKLAGDVGTGRSKGFVKASDVGKNVANDISLNHESNDVFFPMESKYDKQHEGKLLAVKTATASRGADKNAVDDGPKIKQRGGRSFAMFPHTESL